jgi:hypothetical protein
MGFKTMERFSMKYLSVIIISVSICFLIFSSAQVFADNTETSQTVIVVVGAGGTPEYQVQFNQWAGLWEKACSEGNDKYIPIGLTPLKDSNLPRQDTSTAGDVNDLQVLHEIIESQPKEGDLPLWLVFIGHGTFDGRIAKFNMRGPDVSADDLAKWLGPIKRPLAIVNASSSSSPFLNKLSGKDRVVITATKSGYELSYARFGQFISEAISDANADLDKDGQTSLLEAFLAASRGVEEFYSAAGRLATEHALLDDNADGLGTAADWFQGIKPAKQASGNKTPDGYRANQFCLIPSEIERKMPSELRAKRDKLEMEIIKLRDSKNLYLEDEYFSKLENLSLEMAKIYEQFD